MSDFSSPYAPGFTVYALAGLEDGRAWNGTAFVDPAGVRPACAIATTYDGQGSYEGNLPTSLPGGTYLVQSYLQLGGSPADGDPVVGAAFVPFAGGSSTAPATAGLFEKALVASLKANGVVATITSGRVYPRKRPQAAPGGTGPTLPALVYEVGLKGHGRNLDGPNGIARARVVVHCQALLDSDAKALAEQLRFLFDGFGPGLLGTVPVVEAWLDDDPDDYTPPDDGSDAGVFSVPAAFLFRYRETIPAR